MELSMVIWSSYINRKILTMGIESVRNWVDAFSLFLSYGNNGKYVTKKIRYLKWRYERTL